MSSARHRWGEKVRFDHKTEQQCIHCETVKVGRHEWQASGEVHWTEFWRREERIDHDGRTPPCKSPSEQVGE